MSTSHPEKMPNTNFDLNISEIDKNKKDPLAKLAAQLAHDLNVPLASILAYAEELIDLAKERYGIKGFNQLVEYVEIIQKEAYHCKEIVEKMLSYAKGLEIQLETVNINELLLKCINDLQPRLKDKNIRIKTELEKYLPMISTDITGLKQVIMNVLCNAEEAIENEGTITIKTKTVDNSILIEIADTGEGIDEAYLEKIFDPYFTTKEKTKGTGLGLAICDGILQTLRGKITVQSKKGEGTIVRICMPKKLKVIMA